MSVGRTSSPTREQSRSLQESSQSFVTREPILGTGGFEVLTPIDEARFNESAAALVREARIYLPRGRMLDLDKLKPTGLRGMVLRGDANHDEFIVQSLDDSKNAPFNGLYIRSNIAGSPPTITYNGQPVAWNSETGKAVFTAIHRISRFIGRQANIADILI